MDSLRIGVTGHRILAKNHNLEGGFNQVVDALDFAFPNCHWRIYSPLAEGADCLFVQFVLQRPGVQLVVPLPLPVPEYLSGFTSQQSRDTFYKLYEKAERVVSIPRYPTHEAAFQAVGEYILDHTDVIVAIWDGKKAQGQGGTGQIVTEARSRKMPLAWILAGNRLTGTLDPTHLGEKQGIVRFERFDQCGV